MPGTNENSTYEGRFGEQPPVSDAQKSSVTTSNNENTSTKTEEKKAFDPKNEPYIQAFKPGDNKYSVQSKYGSLNFDVPQWGVKDFINERNYWIKGTHLTPGNEPGWFYFKVFFKFNSQYGLFGGLFNEKNDEIQDPSNSPVNSALQYLYSLQNFKIYKMNNLKDRLLSLYKFGALFQNLVNKTPWMIKGISNLQSAMTFNTENFSEEKTIDLLFNQETTDIRLGTLLDLYKYITYDDINNVEILPENLRKFDMSVIIYHMPLKYYHTGISVLEGDSYKKLNKFVDDALNVTRKSLGTFSNIFGNNNVLNHINTGVNVIESINNVAKVFTTKSILMDYKTLYPKDNNFSNSMSYRMFTFHNCEIHTESFGKYLENVELKNESPFQFGSSALKIKYDKVYYHNMNEWNEFMFGSDGFYYNRYVPKLNLEVLNNKEEQTKTNSQNGEVDQSITGKETKNEKLYELDETWALYNKGTADKQIPNNFTERIKHLISAHENRDFRAPDAGQWKALIDYSEIAITNSLKNYGMEDLPMGDNARNFSAKTGNLYGYSTAVPQETDLLFGIQKHTWVGKVSGFLDGINNIKCFYFSRKLSLLKNGEIESGNLFGKIGVITSSSDGKNNELSDYMANKFKLMGLINNSNTVLQEEYLLNALNKYYNTNEYNDLKSSNLTEYNDINKLKKQLKESKKPLNIYGVEYVVNNKEIKDYLKDKNYNLTSFEDYLDNQDNYFTKKLSMFATSDLGIKIDHLKGNIYDSILGIANRKVIKDGDTSVTIVDLSDYFKTKLKTLSTMPGYDDGVIKISGNIYNAMFGIINSSLISEGNTIVNLSDYFNTKLKTLSTMPGYDDGVIKISGNIYGNSLLGIYNEKNTNDDYNYFIDKIDTLKNGGVNGNIYDAIFGLNSSLKRTKIGKNQYIRYKANASDYFINKLKMLGTNENFVGDDINKLSGNIYGKKLYGIYSDRNPKLSKYFIDKIDTLKNGEVRGNIYDYLFGITNRSLTSEGNTIVNLSEYFKTKLKTLSTMFGYNDSITKIYGNIYGKSLTGIYSNETDEESKYFIDKIDTLKNGVVGGNIYDALFGLISSPKYDENGNVVSYNLSEYLKTKLKLMSSKNEDSITKIHGNIYGKSLTGIYGSENSENYIYFIDKINELKGKKITQLGISQESYEEKINKASEIKISLDTIMNGNKIDLRSEQQKVLSADSSNKFDQDAMRITQESYEEKINKASEIKISLDTIMNGNKMDLRSEQQKALSADSSNKFDQDAMRITQDSYEEKIKKAPNLITKPQTKQSKTIFGDNGNYSIDKVIDLRVEQSLATKSEFDQDAMRITQESYESKVPKINTLEKYSMSLSTKLISEDTEGNSSPETLDLLTLQNKLLSNENNSYIFNGTYVDGSKFDLHALQQKSIAEKNNVFNESDNCHTSINNVDYFSIKLENNGTTFNEPKFYDLDHEDKKEIEIKTKKEKFNDILKYFWPT